MQEFLLVGNEKSFSVPPGESRIGSDAACEICVRGEGVLPIHAHLRLDDNKLLIRPASPPPSDRNTGLHVSVAGQPIDGPVIVLPGQAITVGGMEMRLEVRKVRPSLWS